MRFIVQQKEHAHFFHGALIQRHMPRRIRSVQFNKDNNASNDVLEDVYLKKWSLKNGVLKDKELHEIAQ